MDRTQSFQMLDEMKLFARFSAAEQRYIRRSLDIGFGRGDAVARYARSGVETMQMDAQARRYGRLDLIRACLSDDPDPETVEDILAPLITLSVGDLRDGQLKEFEAYRFLYERLVGPEVRPWLVSIFCAAAAMPSIHPELRKTLLQTLPVQDVAAPGWSIRKPIFYPEWVDKVAEVVK